MAFLAGEVLHAAISKAGSVDPTAVLQVLPTLTMTSFFGKIQFNAFGYNQLLPVTTIQRDQNGEAQILAPLVASTGEYIYPAPTWDERFQRLASYDTIAEKVMVGIVGTFMATSVLLIGFVIIFGQRHPFVRAASPPFLVLMLVGTLMIYTAVVLWNLFPSFAACNSVAWLLSSGFGSYTFRGSR